MTDMLNMVNSSGYLKMTHSGRKSQYEMLAHLKTPQSLTTEHVMKCCTVSGDVRGRNRGVVRFRARMRGKVGLEAWGRF